jgi:hypothetical protein
MIFLKSKSLFFKKNDERTQRKLNGIIADIHSNFTSAIASVLDGPDAASNIFVILHTQYNARTLACSGACTSFSAAHPND